MSQGPIKPVKIATDLCQRHLAIQNLKRCPKPGEDAEYNEDFHTIPSFLVYPPEKFPCGSITDYLRKIACEARDVSTDPLRQPGDSLQPLETTGSQLNPPTLLERPSCSKAKGSKGTRGERALFEESDSCGAAAAVVQDTCCHQSTGREQLLFHLTQFMILAQYDTVAIQDLVGEFVSLRF